MKRQRSHIPMKTKLAAALCQMVQPNDDGGFDRIIPHEHAKAMTADQVLAVFAWDHDPIPHAFGGPDEHWNLTPRPMPEHRTKTATRDVPAIAKAERIEAGARAHGDVMLAKAGIDASAPSTFREFERTAAGYGSRPAGRKLQGRGFAKSGKVKRERFVPPS